MSSIQHQREMAMALETSPPIFKLDSDCFEELFDWLSLEDLHSFGRTCKRMQQVAGYYFRSTYPGASVYYWNNGISCNGVQINGFCDYIENIWFAGNDDISFTNEFKSLKKIRSCDITFSDEDIAHIKISLNKVETVEWIEWFYCDTTGDVYERFLQYCVNMKILRVEIQYFRSGMSYDWLLQRYPKLEKLLLTSSGAPILEMKTFFERNPKVQHLAISQEILWANRHSILESNVKLDTLTIHWTYEVDKDDEFRNLLNEFREREVYKHLHLCVGFGCQEVVHQMIPTNSVEKLTYNTLPTHATSILFANLRELHSLYIPGSLNMEAVAGSLLNLERIYFEIAVLNHVFAFICRSRKLEHIAIRNIYGMEGNIIDLALWNEKREKLAGARKVTVYVDEKVYMATKEATNNKYYRLIEIKRFDSQRWISESQCWI